MAKARWIALINVESKTSQLGMDNWKKLQMTAMVGMTYFSGPLGLLPIPSSSSANRFANSIPSSVSFTTVVFIGFTCQGSMLETSKQFCSLAFGTYFEFDDCDVVFQIGCFARFIRAYV